LNEVESVVPGGRMAKEGASIHHIDPPRHDWALFDMALIVHLKRFDS